jgi:hypothetical protein
MDAIYKRFVERDNSPERHRGHIVNTQYPETDETKTLLPVSSEQNPQQFKNIFEQRGTVNFNMGGDIITVDTTDFSNISYKKIIGEIKQILDK